MGEPVIGSELKASVEPKIEGSLVRWSQGLGGAWYGGAIIVGSEPWAFVEPQI